MRIWTLIKIQKDRPRFENQLWLYIGRISGIMLWKCFACFCIVFELQAPASFKCFLGRVYMWVENDEDGSKIEKKAQVATVVVWRQMVNPHSLPPSLHPSVCLSGKSVRSSRTYWAKIVLLWAPPDQPPSWTWTYRDTSHTSGNTRALCKFNAYFCNNVPSKH